MALASPIDNAHASVSVTDPLSSKRTIAPTLLRVLRFAVLFGVPSFFAAAVETGWQFSLGAGTISAPKFPGADRMATFPFPFFTATYNEWFSVSPIDGIGVGFQPVKDLTLSAAIGVDFEERRAKDDARLIGLKDIRIAPDARLNARYEAGGFFLDGTARTRLSRPSGRGTLAEVDAGRSFLVRGPHNLSVGMTVSLMDETYARNFFGVTPAQGAATGMRAFHAQSGLKDLGGFAECNQPLGKQWEFFARVQISRLQPKASGSPIVLRTNQPFLVLTTARRF